METAQDIGNGGRWGSGGLVRPRLIEQVGELPAGGIAMLVAPAGSGKTTLLAQLAAHHSGPVAWCGSPDRQAGPAAELAGWIAPPLGQALGRNPSGTGGGAAPDLDELLGHLARWAGPPVLIVLDDVHRLAGTPAETSLGDLVDRLQGPVVVAMATRVVPGFDLSRARVAGRATHVTADDFRFRTWEVERLFRDVYAEPLHPEDLAELARRTDGWAAYLQLFHLATARKSAVERRRLLRNLSTRSREVNEYLTRHVMADLSTELREFLVRTSVLRRPDGGLCDRLLGRSGSDDMLAELERRQYFTTRVDTEGGYRYHSVLREHLDSELIALLGAEGARAEHRRAADLLAERGLIDDALAAYAKAEEWDEIARVLGHHGPQTGNLGWTWLEVLPRTVVESDPWLLVARSRRSLAAGALADAMYALRQAEAAATSSAAIEVCQRLRAQVTAFLEPAPALPDGWVGVVRAALSGDPLRARARAAGLNGPFGRLAEGVAELLAGNVSSAARLLRNIAGRADCPPVLAAGALLLASFPAAGTGQASTEELAELGDSVAALGVPWLDRMARVLQAAAGPDAAETLDELTEACRREGDLWGEAIAGFVVGTSLVHAGRAPVATLADSADLCARIGAGSLETWSRAYLAVAQLRAGEGDASIRTANRVRAAAARRGIPGAAGAAALTLAAAGADESRARWAREVLEPMGLWSLWSSLVEARPESAGAPGPAVPDPEPPVDRTVLQCLGGFSLVLTGRLVEEGALKPKERQALHLLATHAGQAVHREGLIEALWPGASPDAGLRRLQVALSSIRGVLEPNIGRGQSRHLLRDGDAYRLCLPADADVDLWRLDDGLRSAARARDSGQAAAEQHALCAALDAYRGSLLPAEGPAEWVVRRRTELQLAAAQAAARLAALRIGADPMGAAAAARRGLEIDRYRDVLWELLIEALERADQRAAASLARREYREVLEELGVEPDRVGV